MLFLFFSLFPIWSDVEQRQGFFFFFFSSAAPLLGLQGAGRGSKLIGIAEHNRGYYGCV